MEMEEAGLKVELNEIQQKHFDSVRWLLEPRASSEDAAGRTRLMAVVWVSIVMDYYQGEWVTVFDHDPSYRATENLLSMIRVIVDQDPSFGQLWEMRFFNGRGEIKFDPRRKS